MILQALRVALLHATKPRRPWFSPTSPLLRACSRARNVSGSPDDKQFLLEEMGCGAAFFDYDHDGWLDIFLVNGSSFDPRCATASPASYLFHNNRDGTFTDVTQRPA